MAIHYYIGGVRFYRRSIIKLTLEELELIHQQGTIPLLRSCGEQIMQILWVENHARFVSVALPTFLHKHSVCVVPSLAEARRYLASETFDAILLDYDLDDGKGTELIPNILSLSPRPFLIATSAHATGNVNMLAAGANAICS